MVLSSFSHPQKLACWALARRLIALDATFTDEEHACLQRMLDEMELDEDAHEPADSGDLEGLLAPFATHDDRTKLLLELMILALVDEDYSPLEDDLLAQIVDHFQMSGDLLDRIAAWVRADPEARGPWPQ